MVGPVQEIFDCRQWNRPFPETSVIAGNGPFSGSPVQETGHCRQRFTHCQKPSLPVTATPDFRDRKLHFRQRRLCFPAIKPFPEPAGIGSCIAGNDTSVFRQSNHFQNRPFCCQHCPTKTRPDMATGNFRHRMCRCRQRLCNHLSTSLAPSPLPPWTPAGRQGCKEGV